MIGEIVGYTATAVSAIAAIIFGIRQASNNDKLGIASRLKDVEGRQDVSEKEIQMLKRRELVHERREGILLDALADHNIEIPELPAFPEAWDK